MSYVEVLHAVAEEADDQHKDVEPPDMTPLCPLHFLRKLLLLLIRDLRVEILLELRKHRFRCHADVRAIYVCESRERGGKLRRKDVQFLVRGGS